ncbi:hypothetical protein, partial [Undibacterium sp. TC9W]|uniref:hypothetical protein n=1 Tax=Undibacterium sp. TC9W TaxID=3413053 RepID=UPI003BF13908
LLFSPALQREANYSKLPHPFAIPWRKLFRAFVEKQKGALRAPCCFLIIYGYVCERASRLILGRR